MKILEWTEDKRVCLMKGKEIPTSILKGYEVDPETNYRVTIELLEEIEDENNE